MQKLTKEEVNRLTPLNNGRETLLSAQIKQLQTGEGLVIQKHEWKAKYHIGRMVKTAGKTTNRTFTCHRMPDGNGWLIVRLT